MASPSSVLKFPIYLMCDAGFKTQKVTKMYELISAFAIQKF